MGRGDKRDRRGGKGDQEEVYTLGALRTFCIFMASTTDDDDKRRDGERRRGKGDKEEIYIPWEL